MQKQYLLAASVLATLLVSATSEDFEFYKLSLQWPTSSCNIRAGSCETPYPNYFTIHGLWPQFSYDDPVPPYRKDPTCTNITPTRNDQLMPLLQPIERQLAANWPNLILNKPNLVFWQHEWEAHGMCSDYPDRPKEYFIAALTLAANFDPLKVIGIEPGTQTTTGTILENVYRELRAFPQIACNKKGRDVQLWEVRFCFDRTQPPFRVRSCPTRFAGQCSTWGDKITFPATPSFY